jgi:glutathionylspermidine synthase
LIDSLEETALEVWQVLLKASEVMASFSDHQLLEYGYPHETFRLLREREQQPFIARCDFAVIGDRIYLIECNAEVATFVVETFFMNGKVANHFNHEDPNSSSEKILKQELNIYIHSTANYLGKDPQNCHVVFGAIGDAIEDMGTANYLHSLCQFNSDTCPLDLISMDLEKAYDAKDREIDLLYRIYPTEWMIEDQDPLQNVSLWNYLEPIIYKRNIALINPVNTLITQNKALMALVTQLGANFFGENAHAVSDHFLPTYMNRNEIEIPFVSKPTFGREGMEVMLYTSSEQSAYNLSTQYAEFPVVYQRYVPMPEIMLDNQTYTLQFSCFLVNGIPTGVGARIGDRVISNTSSFLPIGILSSD